MLDQVSNSNVNSNIFAQMQTNNAPYTIMPKNIKTLDEKEKKSDALGYEIATTALVAGIGVLAFTKGLPKPLRLQVEKLTKRLDEKVSVLKENPQLGKAQKIYLSALEKTKSLATKSKVLFDTASLKDNLLHSGLKRVPGLRTVDSKITEVFRNISIKKYENAYSKTLVSFDRMYADFSNVNNFLKNSEDKAEAEKLIKDIKTNYDKTFSSTIRRKRLNDTLSSLSGIDDAIFDSTYKAPKQYVKNKMKNQNSIAEEKAAPMKEALQQRVTNAKSKINTSIDDLMSIYKKAHENGEIGDKDYQKLINSRQKSTKTLNKATDIESDKLFDKLRDLEIGSAPMDVLGILTSIGVISWQLRKADDNDERISISLKSGIPIIGGMLTSLYCAVALVATGPSMILGVLSGLAINKVGSAADKYRLGNKDKPVNLVESAMPEGLAPVKDDKTKKVDKSV